jgi:hypothetical protein
MCKAFYFITFYRLRFSTRSFKAVRSSPAIKISANAGAQIKSVPLGATNPRAMATAFTAWLSAPAPTACISACPFSLITATNAPATEFGLERDDTFNESTIIPPRFANSVYAQQLMSPFFLDPKLLSIGHFMLGEKEIDYIHFLYIETIKKD